MARPAFQQAWQRLLPDLDGSFDELKAICLVASARSQPVLSTDRRGIAALRAVESEADKTAT
jgi:hypothetical protein